MMLYVGTLTVLKSSKFFWNIRFCSKVMQVLFLANDLFFFSVNYKLQNYFLIIILNMQV